MTDLFASQTRKHTGADKFALLGAIFCMVGLAITYFLVQDTKRREAETMIEVNQRAMLVNELEKSVADKLTDPDSAKFRGLALYHDPNSTSMPDNYFGEYNLCGEFNSKNQFGGYVGYRSFISEMYIGMQGDKVFHGAHSAFIEETASNSFFSDLQAKACKGLQVPIDQISDSR